MVRIWKMVGVYQIGGCVLFKCDSKKFQIGIISP